MRLSRCPGARCSLRKGYFFALALLGSCGTLNGAARTIFVIAPLRMHCVQTSSALWLPFAVETFTRCRLGLNVRRLMPVTFVPTPPKYFFLPRVVTRLPICALLPHIPHCRAIAYLVSIDLN